MKKYKVLGVTKNDAYYGAMPEEIKDKVFSEDGFKDLKKNKNNSSYQAWIGNNFFIGLRLKEVK